MGTRNILQAMIVLAVSAAPGLAVADINASATFSNFGYTLQDLDVNDGITPALTFAGLDYEYNAAVGYVQVRRYEGSTVRWFQSSTQHDAEGNPVTAGVNDGSAFTYSASVDGRTALSTLTVQTQLALSQSEDVMHDGTSWMHSDAHRFFITPNTKVTFHGTLALDAAITGNEQVHQRLNISGSSIIWSPAIPGYGEVYSVRERERNLISTDGLDRTLVEDVLILNELWNYSDVERFGQVGFSIDATTSGVPPQVPEPGTYAMLGAGLALLGAIARRRRH